jgi:hypothetical protein
MMKTPRPVPDRRSARRPPWRIVNPDGDARDALAASDFIGIDLSAGSTDALIFAREAPSLPFEQA